MGLEYYYNIPKYLKIIMGVEEMVFDGIINGYTRCKPFKLDEAVEDYLYYIKEEPFYIAPQFSSVKTDSRVSSLNPIFCLFSAPGATGKSALAEHIANRYGALYWNLAKIKLGTNSFVGSIVSAVGAANYSEFISDLNSCRIMLVIDALDEAEIISGRKMLCSFLQEIKNCLDSCIKPCIFLLARTETAQFIASFCAENDIAISHYEIGFFTEDSAKKFIEEKSVDDISQVTPADKDCVNSYYHAVQRSITSEESVSFLGYAPVLEAIAKHIKTCPNKMKLISELSGQMDCVSLIMKIMGDLLDRERDKVISAFKLSCEEQHPEFSDWDSLYSDEEQLVRIIHYIVFQRDIEYSNYTVPLLPPQLVDEYQGMLERFLPQHPFIRSSNHTAELVDFTGPAFRDYTLARLILSPSTEDLAYVYFEESQSKSYFPSQIFIDCYTNISSNVVHTNHISYVYDSFRAKATAMKTPFLQCTILPGSNEPGENNYAVFYYSLPNKKQDLLPELVLTMVVDKPELSFSQMTNISIDVPDFDVNIGHVGGDSLIYNTSIICKNLILRSNSITIESYSPYECLIVAKGKIIGNPVIEISRNHSLKVSSPNISDYYRLIPYKYDYEDASSIDPTKFVHALRNIMSEFRTHRKDTLAKSAERIEYVNVGGSGVKRAVLEYLKDSGIVYLSEHLYKIDEDRMQEKGINFNALSRLETNQLSNAYSDFCKWNKSIS